MLFFTVFGVIALSLAIAMGVAAVKSRDISQQKRVALIFCAALLSVPGLFAVYMMLIFVVVLFQ
ncbi:MAG: hypothetical protein EOR97_24510 [Mesorhizobium sp.]|uniref:hypothetical protein n=1 Tax=Mesorhizobium sp. TaxID=1871066 RepID=UPI000FE7969F|nr:hypothetical protein [Mesorhizobium sp.]RWN27743.1 MAG: hypothetical protein EOR97_24510 [Mesorhizobium sp.]